MSKANRAGGAWQGAGGGWSLPLPGDLVLGGGHLKLILIFACLHSSRVNWGAVSHDWRDTGLGLACSL